MDRSLLNMLVSSSTSFVVHLVVIMVMALVTIGVIDDKKDLEIVSKVEEATELEEFEEPPTELELNPEIAEATVSDVPTDLTTNPEAVEPTEVVTPFADADAAPINTPDLLDYADRTAPKSDLMREIGASGGTGFEGRGSANRGDMVAKRGGNEASEKAVAAALKWLSEHQNYDGSWSFDHRKGGNCQGACKDPGSYANALNGATGLALLPFLGAGQTHRDGKYKETVKRGLGFLVRNMKPNNGGGSLMDSDGHSGMYSHGICSIVLCEAYGMTQDRDLQGPAQAAINFIVYAQDPVGGGWRYQPRTPGDTSVVGWQLMALKSGHLAYLNVPPQTVKSASKYLDSVQANSGANYGYMEPGQQPTTSAIGLLCRMYLGWKHDNPALGNGVDFLAKQGPSTAGNMYYNYYATQVMCQYDGPKWEAWNKVMRDSLTNSQSKNGHETGSWYLRGGDHGAASGGRLYTTSMATMILEVYYRHMPIYKEEATTQDFPL